MVETACLCMRCKEVKFSMMKVMTVMLLRMRGVITETTANELTMIAGNFVRSRIIAENFC